MNGGGSNFPSPQPNGGDFLLSLFFKTPAIFNPQSPTTQQSPTIDPAIAMMGPIIPTNGHDHPNFHPRHLHYQLPPTNSVSLAEYLRRLGFPIESSNKSNSSFVQEQQQELKLQFGSLPTVSYATTSHEVSSNSFLGFGEKRNNRGNVGHELLALRMSSMIRVD